MLNKIALGTANFGLNYGINNLKGKVSDNDILDILSLAKKKGIQYIDTAQAYGNAENRLGEALKKTNSSFNIVTKLLPSFAEDTQNLTNNSRNKLGLATLYGVLYHDFQDFLKRQDSFTDLTYLKEKGEIKKIGFSVYYPSEIEYLFEQNINFDIVQFPYSVFDRRFESVISKLKKRNIEIHTRSVFLQGIVFMDPQKLPAYLKGAYKNLLRLKQISIKSNISIGALCLNFALNNQAIDKVIIGVDSPQQLEFNLEEISNYFGTTKIDNQLAGLAIENENIILPFNWK